MHIRTCRNAALLTGIVILGGAFAGHSQGLTFQVGTPPPPPTVLVDHLGTWNWHKGTNAPQAGWQTVSDATLNTDWGTGPGGFGYSNDTANETNQCRTILRDMSGTSATNYSTFYIRKAIDVASAIDPSMRIQLTVDYDDAFVAYFDGVEVARSANAPGSVGTEPAYTALATSTHESSRGTSTPVNPPAVYDLGAVGSRLSVGTHTLAVIGLNQNKSTSSDFILIVDLALTGGTGGTVVSGPLSTIVQTNSVIVSGSNTIAGATRVLVNGDDASVNSALSTWSKIQTLVPGVNKLFVAAVDNSGAILASTNYIIVSDVASTAVGGTIADDTVWTSAMGTIHVTNRVIVPPGLSLRIDPGCVLLFGSGTGILATNSSLVATGTVASPVYFLPLDVTSTNWGELAISGTNGSMLIRHAESISGHFEVLDGATGTLEDSSFHDYWTASPAIIHTLGVPNHVTLNLRRCYIAHYQEVLSQVATNHIEDCLLEYQGYSGDGIDFDFGQEGSYIRRCTVRRGLIFNTDALDMGEYGADGTRVLIDSCLLHDFIDKGVSMGVQVYVTVTNTLIYNTDAGFGIKDNSEAGIFNCTVANVNYGFHEYNKANANATNGGGHVTNSFNNIVWMTTNITVSLANGSTFVGTFSDLYNLYPGDGNFSADPLFVDPARHDYHVSAGSPTRGSGLGGVDMGVTFPVGGIPATPLRLAALTAGTNDIVLTWVDDADNEDGVEIERSIDQTNWTVIGSAAANATNYTDLTAVLGTKYYYRARATNTSGVSGYANVAGGARQALTINVGGTISSDTTWFSYNTYVVTSALTIASSATLTIQAGTQVKFNSGIAMTVNGRILGIGNETNHIHLTKSGTVNWGSLDFIGATNESRLEWVDIDSCAGTTIGGHASEFHINGASRVFFDHLNFANTPAQEYLSFDGSTFIVQNSVFPTYPWAMSAPEMLHGVNGINAGGYGIFRSNYFGHTFGFNDTIDFTGGQRPGPILQVIGNVFDGAGDDHLDLDSTDAWIEGNIFMHVHRDPNRTDRADDTGSAISGGVDVDGQFSEWTVINNLFYDVDHVFLNKGGVGSGAGRVIFMNNTVVHVNQESGAGPSTNIAAFIFTDDQVAFPAATYGAGAYIANNIIWDCPMLATNYNPSIHTVIFENNIVSGPWTGLGSNNLVVDPLLNLQLITTVTNATAAQVKAAFTPKTNSPALGTGFGGKYDKGGLNPLGIMVYGEPSGVTTSSNATLTVGPIEAWRYGSAVPPYNGGYTFYKWKLDNGPWSAEISTTNSPTISLSNLVSGPHTVYLVGRNDAGIGYYQDDPFLYPTNIPLIAAHVTASSTWIVGSGSGITDTDGDGLPDDWEITHGLNPNDPSDAGLDSDGDGLTNLQEYLAGTDPQDPASRLFVQIAAANGTNALISFQTASNKTYTIQYRDGFTTGSSWLRLQDIAAGASRTVTVTNSPGLPQRYYRIVTPALP